uniref:Uncharacterized protein n=1 Tax=Oryza nivara TaxID=4536 RepID=A0A0E0J9H6_ORYNI
MAAMPRRPVLWPPAGGRRTLLCASPDRRRVALVRAGPHALRLCSARWPARECLECHRHNVTALDHHTLDVARQDIRIQCGYQEVDLV